MPAPVNSFEAAIAKNGQEAMRPRQDPLMETYRHDSDAAQIVDHAVTRTTTTPAHVPLYTEVVPNKGGAYPIGVHKAVGGLSDFSTPGDLLCAAIASCLDSTIRIIASRMDLVLKDLEVSVSGHVDVRGTLRVDDQVPVGFQKIEINVKIEPEKDIPPAYLDALLKAAEHSCVVLQTINQGPSIGLTRMTNNAEQPAETIA